MKSGELILLNWVLFFCSCLVYFIYRKKKKSKDWVNGFEGYEWKVKLTHEEVEKLLARYGRKGAPFRINEAYLPIHSSFLNLINAYEEISLNEGSREFDRSLLRSPLPENTQFMQIGTWDDESTMLIKLKSDDPRVYFIDSELLNFEEPFVFADSLHTYFEHAFESYQELLKDFEKQTLKKSGKKRALQLPVDVSTMFHPSFVRIIEGYEEILIKDSFHALFDRNLFLEKLNRDAGFSQIGIWSKDKDVVIMKNPDNPCVYFVTPGKLPELLALDFKEYAFKALDFFESEAD